LIVNNPLASQKASGFSFAQRLSFAVLIGSETS
jgi:hypothetical protein